MNASSALVRAITTVAFLIGAIGNVAVLFILHRSARRRNKKHVLLLRWLAINDLTSQIGMVTLLYLNKYNKVLPDYWGCVGFVLIRAFGFGSGCVALVMALERWLALTRPFLYYQLVTYQILKRFLCCLWLTALLLTYLPLFGFGLYYDFEQPAKDSDTACVRFRYAKTLNDKIYAYLYFACGSILCLSISLCNMAVVCELTKIRIQRKVLVRRISRSIITSNRTNNDGCPRNQTPEEVAFAKLMGYTCVIFVVCWAPQLISVPIAQLYPSQRINRIWESVADVLLCAYFTLDPYIYVLQRYMEMGKCVFPFCFFRQKSVSSLPTTTTTGTVETPNTILLQPAGFTFT